MNNTADLAVILFGSCVKMPRLTLSLFNQDQAKQMTRKRSLLKDTLVCCNTKGKRFPIKVQLDIVNTLNDKAEFKRFLAQVCLCATKTNVSTHQIT